MKIFFSSCRNVRVHRKCNFPPRTRILTLFSRTKCIWYSTQPEHHASSWFIRQIYSSSSHNNVKILSFDKIQSNLSLNFKPAILQVVSIKKITSQLVQILDNQQVIAKYALFYVYTYITFLYIIYICVCIVFCVCIYVYIPLCSLYSYAGYIDTWLA